MKGFKGFTNTACEFFPCHQGVKRADFNCLFCYCPLVDRECPGPYKVIDGKYGIVKDCSDCTLPHDGIEQSWKLMQRWRSVAPLWGHMPQSQEKIRRYSSYVRQFFEEIDLAWADEATGGSGNIEMDQL
jgi:Zn-finger protein